MSFYSRHPSMGFFWVAPAVQLLGSALSSQPIDSTIVPPKPTDPALIAAGILGGIAIIGGVLYLAVRK